MFKKFQNSSFPSWLIFISGMMSAILFFVGGSALGWISCDNSLRNKTSNETVNQNEEFTECNQDSSICLKESLNYGGNYYLEAYYSQKDVSFIIDSAKYIIHPSHKYYIDDNQILYRIYDDIDVGSSYLKTYNFETQTKKEIQETTNKNLFDVTETGWWIYMIRLENNENEYTMEKDGQSISLGKTKGYLGGISPSGNYATLSDHFEAQTKITEDTSKKIYRYGSFAVFPLKENGISEAVYLGDVSVSLGGLTAPTSNKYSIWSDDEKEVKDNSFFSSSDYFKNPLAE